MLLCIRLNSRLKDSLRTRCPIWTFYGLKWLELTQTALEATQADLTVCQAELTRAQAELHQLQFQLSQQKILGQVKEREIQRLRSAALSATDASQAVSQAAAASSAVPNYTNHELSSSAPTVSLPSWVHLDAPVSTSPVVEEVQAQTPQMPEASSSDPRIDQLVDAVQLITNRLENLNGMVSPTRRVDDDPSDEINSAGDPNSNDPVVLLMRAVCSGFAERRSRQLAAYKCKRDCSAFVQSED